MKRKNVFLGKRKAEKYLKVNKDHNQQIELLRRYVSNELEHSISKYHFDQIEVFVDKLKNGTLDLQVNVNINGNFAGLDFYQDYYEYIFYHIDSKPEEIDDSIVRYNYDDFDLDRLLSEIKSNLQKKTEIKK
jgi:hypothetical protein